MFRSKAQKLFYIRTLQSAETKILKCWKEGNTILEYEFYDDKEYDTEVRKLHQRVNSVCDYYVIFWKKVITE